MSRYALLVVALLTIIACVRASAESSESRQRWVNEINLYRCIHGLPPLLWDTGLADTASQFAGRLSTTGQSFSDEPSRTTLAFGFGKFHCGDRYREFDQTCAVWFWYLQYLDTFGQEGCGSVTLAERAWSPRDIEDVKIMLSDRVQYVGCASRGHFYACKFDGNCGEPEQPCGKNTTELQHCVDEACFWCRDNTRVSSCWKWNPYVDLGTTTTTTTTTRPLVDGSKMYVTTTISPTSVTPSRTSNLRGRSTLPTTTTNSTTAVLPTSGGWTDKDGPIAMMDEISEDIEMDTVDSMESHNFYCETPELATAAHAFCSSIRRGSWCQLDQTPPTCFDESHLCGCFGDRDVPRDFYNPTGNCSVLESHYFCQAETRNGRCNFGAGPPYLCEDSDTNCACDRL